MDGKNVATLLAAFVAILIGVVLIGTVAGEIDDLTSKLDITNEAGSPTILVNPGGGDINLTKQYTITNAPTGWKGDDCPITNFAMQNASGDGGQLTLNTDYAFTAQYGNYTYLNSTAIIGIVNGSWTTTANTTYLNYTYCPDDYLKEGWHRSVSNLVPGFFALGILGVGVGLVFMIMRREGIL